MATTSTEVEHARAQRAEARMPPLGAAWRPTPTQQEIDLAAAGQHVMTKAPDGSPSGTGGPIATTNPAITGSPALAGTLTCSAGVWVPASPTLAASTNT